MVGNSKEVNDEQLKQRYSPEGSALRRDQKELLRMLKKVDAICKEHNLKWWLSSGTLLGAARHKGFIPWDDDIDIVMLRKDAKRLEKILHKMDDPEFVFHTMRSDVEYVNCFGKYRKREGCIAVNNRRYDYYKWRGIGFDIFSLEKTSFFAAKAASTIYGNLQHLTSYIRCGVIRKPLIRFIELLCLGIVFPILRVIGLINPKGEYHYSLGQGWSKHTFFMSDAFPLTTTEFEGEQMPAPKNMDAYLTRVYGDWRKLPNEEQIRKSIHNQEYIKEIYGDK